MAKRILLFILCLVMFNPIMINKAQADIKGVKPSEACDLFIDSGLATSGWKIYYNYVCGCSSEHEHSISEGQSMGNLSYNVEGTCKSINRLKISFDIECSDCADKLIAELQDAARVLIEKITEQPAPVKILNAIDQEKRLSMKIGETIVKVGRIDWTRMIDGRIVDGYQIMVTLE
jgi:hypothetical protein